MWLLYEQIVCERVEGVGDYIYFINLESYMIYEALLFFLNSGRQSRNHKHTGRRDIKDKG